MHSERGSTLRDQITHADPGLPIVLLLSEESDYVIKTLFHLAERYLPSNPAIVKGPGKQRRFVQMISAKDLLQFEWKNVLEMEQWMIIQNSQDLNIEEIGRLTVILENIYGSELRKGNFKCFIILYPEGEMVSFFCFKNEEFNV